MDQIFTLMACTFGVSQERCAYLGELEALTLQPIEYCKKQRKIPYISLFDWDHYSDKLDVFFLDVRSSDNLLNTSILLVKQASELGEDHRYLISELGIQKIVDLSESLSTVNDFFNLERYQSELIGSNYSYAQELNQLLRSKEKTFACNLLDRMAISERDDAKAMLMVHARIKIGDLGRLKRVLLELIDRFPDFYWCVKHLSRLYLKTADYYNFLDLTERLQHLHRLNPLRTYHLGVLYQKIADFPRAVRFFQEGLDNFPQYRRRFYDGNFLCHLATGQEQVFVDEYLREAPISVDVAASILKHVRAKAMKGSYEEALKTISQLRSSKFDEPETQEPVLYIFAVLSLCLGKVSDCLEACQKLSQARPSYILLAENLLAFIQVNRERMQTPSAESGPWSQEVLSEFSLHFFSVKSKKSEESGGSRLEFAIK